ncbi:D-aminoacyl-tRNA deacylase [Cimex lectularius]|uniref:D-aminoacyl-tRNA deacylase n=1 Tax=Cimex lectularius TaxID=79782 RepID=A0A8I6TJZ2_CIMLE|nr:D-aminoacyl-tRNA deacylase [Cimex lectularius]
MDESGGKFCLPKGTARHLFQEGNSVVTSPPPDGRPEFLLLRTILPRSSPPIPGHAVTQMRAVVQKVASASAKHAGTGEIISSIGKGLCVLVGISREDTKKDLDYIVNKILNLKLFEDEGETGDSTRRWKKSVKDRRLEVLCLSQVTLCHSFKGNKVDFHHAMAPGPSRAFYAELVEALRSRHDPDLVKEGAFGEHLVIELQNDGPVTITLESPGGGVCSETEEQTVPDMDNVL